MNISSGSLYFAIAPLAHLISVDNYFLADAGVLPLLKESCKEGYEDPLTKFQWTGSKLYGLPLKEVSSEPGYGLRIMTIAENKFLAIVDLEPQITKEEEKYYYSPPAARQETASGRLTEEARGFTVDDMAALRTTMNEIRSSPYIARSSHSYGLWYEPAPVTMPSIDAIINDALADAAQQG